MMKQPGNTNPRRRARTPAVLAVSAALLAISTTGGAVAGSLVTGRQIKDGTVTTADIKDRTVTAQDLAPSVNRRLGASGPRGAAGRDGATGAPGASGPAGAQGAPGPASWDRIPRGVTVTGQVNVISDDVLDYGNGVGVNAEIVELPAHAPVDLEKEMIRFGAHASVPEDVVDDRCSGEFQTPTAPPGLVCVYVAGVTGASLVSGQQASLLRDQAFAVYWHLAAGSTTVAITATWAYTAP
jgi:hypothetical protein